MKILKEKFRFWTNFNVTFVKKNASLRSKNSSLLLYLMLF